MKILNLCLLLFFVLFTSNLFCSLKDLLLPPSYYRAEISKYAYYNKTNELALKVDLCSQPFEKLPDSLTVPMDFQVVLSFKGTKVTNVLVDSLTMLNKKNEIVYSLHDLSLTPFKTNKFSIGTDSLNGSYQKMQLLYTTGSTSILGKRIQTDPKFSINTNTGVHKVVWSPNSYTFLIKGSYTNKKGISVPFAEQDILYLFFDPKNNISIRLGF